jgi:hypothetical protein
MHYRGLQKFKTAEGKVEKLIWALVVSIERICVLGTSTPLSHLRGIRTVTLRVTLCTHKVMFISWRAMKSIETDVIESPCLLSDV